MGDIMLGALFGLASGIISGMGIGGGVILIPLLVLFMNIDQHAAQGINLFYFLPTAAVALYVHIKNKNIDFRAAITLALFSLLGAAGGSLIAIYSPSPLLKKMFAILLFAMGLYELFKKKEN